MEPKERNDNPEPTADQGYRQRLSDFLSRCHSAVASFQTTARRGLRRILRLLLVTPLQSLALLMLSPFYLIGLVESKLIGPIPERTESPPPTVPDKPDGSQHNQVTVLVDLWKKIVDVQQHFNDLELRIRNFAVTLVVGLLGVTGLAVKEGLFIRLGNDEVSLGVPLLLGGIIAAGAFWFMDRLWYHRLLYGAVRQGMKIETKLTLLGYPEATLTDAIGKESPFSLLWKNGPKVHSKQKIDLFYGLLLLGPTLVFLALILLGTTGQQTHKKVQDPPPVVAPSAAAVPDEAPSAPLLLPSTAEAGSTAPPSSSSSVPPP